MADENIIAPQDNVLIDWANIWEIKGIKYQVGDEVAKVLIWDKQVEAVVDEYQIIIQEWFLYWKEEHLIWLMTTDRSLFTLYIWELEITLNSDYWVENIEELTELLRAAKSTLRSALNATIEIANNQIEQEDKIKESKSQTWKLDPRNIKNNIEVKLLDASKCREIVIFDQERIDFIWIVINKIETAIDSYISVNSEDVWEVEFNKFINELRNILLLMNSIKKSVFNRQQSVKNIMKIYNIKEK